ncbi:MAG: hypothetical protein Rhob2KO_17000 [Rhodopirellula baltica]
MRESQLAAVPCGFDEQLGRSLSAFEMNWQAWLLPRTTGANAQTAHMVMPDHSYQPASHRKKGREQIIVRGLLVLSGQAITILE